jgi:hypothetical protein
MQKDTVQYSGNLTKSSTQRLANKGNINQINLQMNIKSTAFPSKVIKTQRVDGMLGFQTYSGVQHN